MERKMKHPRDPSIRLFSEQFLMKKILAERSTVLSLLQKKKQTNKKEIKKE